MHEKALRGVFFLRNASDHLITTLCTKMKSEVYTSADYIVLPKDPSEKLYVVERGTVIINGTRVIGANRSFGSEVLYTNTGVQANYTAYALTDTVVLTLDRETLHEAIDAFESLSFRTRIKWMKNCSHILRSVRRASKVVVHTLNVQKGIDVLASELGGRDMILVPQCPLIGHWRRHCVASVEREGKDLSYPEAVATLKSWQEADRANAERNVEKASSSKLASPSKKRWTVSIAKVRHCISKRRSLTPSHVVQRQFDALEKSRIFLGQMSLFRRRHELALDRFLRTQFDARHRMQGHLHLLHDVHGLTLPLLRKVSASDLCAAGLSLANAVRLVDAIRKYPDQPVDNEAEPNASDGAKDAMRPIVETKDEHWI